MGPAAPGGPGQGEELRPGQQLAGQGDDLAPELVLGEAFQREVPQAGVLGAANPVLAPRPAAVTQFQVSELAAFRVGGESVEPVPVEVGEPQLRSRVRALLPHDDAHPGRPPGKVQQLGDVRDSGTVADLPVAVVSRRPRGRGDFPDGGLHVLGDRHADRVVQPPRRGSHPFQEPVGAAA